MKKALPVLAVVLIFVLGLGIMLYPAVANYLNAQSQTVAIDQYEEAARANTAYYEGLLEQAQAFNEGVLKRGTLAVMTEAEKAEYNSLLNLNGDGVMGYIEIPKLDLRLSIAHGTDEDVLQKMVGHVEGTSLPVGGESTHAVLSAHRGLPTAKLFSDLDLMHGDRFTIYTLNQALTYQVDQITVILPEEIEALAIEPGKDYVTLMTCTPYAVNTHRLLVRGVRVPDDAPTPEPESEPEKEPLDARRMLQNVVLPATAGILFVIMTVLLLKVVRGGRRKK
ncbi:MAG: class C sortase [Lachnospiraceae bacterium]